MTDSAQAHNIGSWADIGNLSVQSGGPAQCAEAFADTAPRFPPQHKDFEFVDRLVAHLSPRRVQLVGCYGAYAVKARNPGE
jgi:hypothetical protein